ncbi:MAG: nuclear transport factor 2 family protein [Gammaproteobacteria bacterium]|nr:nuclear transport factor 2 family protein [Gammaproteobacteria bacterium]MBT5722974.1 nuclear transport factor 2 family protein [Gammaproteobacteria bacterium]MBT6892697.1 nuclear transport factor 2 family protein [Gammaproteobacteria bacterium]MBT7876878.1 nuclear transport factor 2 family protein [Gammaproteobacteria bacterium]
MKYFMVLCFSMLGLQAGADEVKQIETLYEQWREAVATADIPSYVAVLDPDVRLIPPGADVIEGAAHYAQFLTPVFDAATYRIEVIAPPRVEILDDIAVAEYEYVVHLKLKNPAQGVTEAGALTASRTEARYFDVLRKNEAGEFRVWRHTWH